MHLSREEFHDMMIFRQTVEFKCVELAVLNATEDDIRQLEEALNNMLINKGDYKSIQKRITSSIWPLSRPLIIVSFTML